MKNHTYSCHANSKVLCEQCCDCLEAERDALLQTLAKERDEFGKRETELIRDCTASKAKLDNQMDGMGLLEKSIERQDSRTHEIQADRDRWREIAETFVKEARLIKAYFEDQWEIVLHKNGVRPLIEALSLYDKAAGK